MIFTNTYFDFEDFETPVKSYIDERIFSKIAPSFTKIREVKMQTRSYSTRDHIFQVVDGSQEAEFVGVESIESDFDSYDERLGAVFTVRMNMDPRSLHFERTVYSFLAFTGDLGGVFEILEILGTFVVYFLTSKLFMYSVLSNLYQVDNSQTGTPGTLIRRKTSRNKRLASLVQVVPEVLKRGKSSKPNTSIQNAETPDLNTQQNEKSTWVITKALDSLKNRKQYTYSWRDICYNLVCCTKSKKWSWCTRSLQKRYSLYLNGEKQYNHELDIVHIVKSLRKIETVVAAFMDEDQRFLAEYQYNNVIDDDFGARLNTLKTMASFYDYKESYKDDMLQYLTNQYTQVENKKMDKKDIKLLMGIYGKNKATGADLSKNMIKKSMTMKLVNRKESNNSFDSNLDDSKAELQSIPEELEPDIDYEKFDKEAKEFEIKHPTYKTQPSRMEQCLDEESKHYN